MPKVDAMVKTLVIEHPNRTLENFFLKHVVLVPKIETKTDLMTKSKPIKLT